MEYSLLAAFLLGLGSALHCLGMCGSIIGALTLSLPSEVRLNRSRLAVYVLAYNLGRISSYALAGAVIAVVGHQLFALISPRYGHLVLQGLATLFMVGVGLHLAGWFPHFAGVERLGRPVWARLEPLAQRLVPVTSPLGALGFGLVWGWLPCGLVYTALVFTASAGDSTQGALYMAAFGLGTLPATAAAGILTDLMVKGGRLPYARQALGVMVMALALISLGLTVGGTIGPQPAPLSAPSHLGHGL